MLKKLMSRAAPLRIDLAGRKLSFNSIGDFEFALACRTEVPSAKVSELIHLSASKLRDEAVRIRQVERRFIDMLAQSIEQPRTIGGLLREAGAKLFSQDHQWRSIIEALIDEPHEYDDFKKMALVKYVQYLAARQDVLRSIYLSKGDRAGGIDTDGVVAGHAMSTASEPASDNSSGSAAMRETVIFDLTRNRAENGSPHALERLPLGEPVLVTMPRRGAVNMALSSRPCKLVDDGGLAFIDAASIAHRVKLGRNSIGRQPANDIVVDAAFRDVSRKHAVIDWDGGEVLLLTDLSSHGTYVAASALRRQ